MKKTKSFNSNASKEDHSGQAKTRKEIAEELKLSIATFKRRLHEIGFKNGGRLITPSEQIKIKMELGFLSVNTHEQT